MTSKINRKLRLEELKANPDDPRHGTATGYGYGCRCSKCKEAYRAYVRERNAAALRKMQDPEDPRHGTKRGYEYGCRCESCKAARSEYEHARKEKTLSALNTDPSHRLHGTYQSYRTGCRCYKCVSAYWKKTGVSRERMKRRGISSAELLAAMRKRRAAEMEYTWEI